jgi:hypothetical protein
MTEPDVEVLPNNLLKTINTQLDHILNNLRHNTINGTAIPIDDIAAELLTSHAHRDTLAIMLAVTLQRLIWT